MNIRMLVYSAYPAVAWKKKIDGMSDTQVAAIYFSLKKRGVLK
jgi:hypothetical protein